MGSMWRVGILALSASSGTLIACSAAQPGAENVSHTSQALSVEVTNLGISSPFIDLDGPFPAGVAATKDAVFVGSPFEAKVNVYSRFTRTKIAELPPPPNGFVLPFIMKDVKDGHAAVLDAGGFPSPKPFVPASPSIYEYSYSIDHGVFSAELVRSISLASATIGFSEDAIQLDDGRYLVDDAVLGSIWIVNLDGTVEPGLTPKSFNPADTADMIPQTFFCDTMPLIHVGGVPFLFTDSTVPGITSMAALGPTLYFSASCAGAVYSIPIATLTDHRQPFQRAADLRVVSRKPAGVQVEELLGLTINKFDPQDQHLYAADALQLRVIRIDPRTGKRDIVGDDPQLFNFPSSLSFAPPLFQGGLAPLVTVSNQQQLTTLLNDAITVDMFQPPFLATITYLHDED